MNFLIAGGYDTKNLGDYASFLGLKKILGKDHNYTILSRHPNDNFSSEFNVKCVKNLDHETKEESRGRIFNGFNSGDDNSHLLEIYQEIKKCNALILGNGRLFVDISLGFMTGPLSYYATLVTLAKFIGKPIILYSVSLVHPKTEQGKSHLKFILDNADLILVRESSSAEVALSYLKRNNKLHILPDIAFYLSSEDKKESNILIPQDAIGVNFRGVDFTAETSSSEVKNNANKVVNLIKNYNKNIVFISQCFYQVDKKNTDDREINKLIFNKIPSEYKKRCTFIDKELTLSQTLFIYSKITHLFTTRRHGFILSLTQGTGASLICNEVNTQIVKETVEIPELFIDKNSEFIIPEIDKASLNEQLKKLSQECMKYKEHIDYVIVTAAHQTIGNLA
ncbi:polysaccharide pyruvyl transferase family protein [Shewanella sp. GD04112]|uniref:polysaccharide pyruvyl transferase family protein n=1 Tax=Shewanella sp. GD04112 TaxID=2975434 RepID=UPI00244BBF8A|nr:polysaccharide pyruvyl transferase family protein [Shewanella sp. GD04112]MDH0447856.1 polysaccharide pyruvyl transferase family protein [Shewanella sp. GD04112]